MFRAGAIAMALFLAPLAWRFVSWALKTGGPAVHCRIQLELARSRDAAASIPPFAARSDGAAHGLLSAAQRSELRAVALRDVVLPCAGVLLGVALGSEPVAAAACMRRNAKRVGRSSLSLPSAQSARHRRGAVVGPAAASKPVFVPAGEIVEAPCSVDGHDSRW